jgi:hypothetical protein
MPWAVGGEVPAPYRCGYDSRRNDHGEEDPTRFNSSLRRDTRSTLHCRFGRSCRIWGKQPLDPIDKARWHFPCRQPGPLHCLERVGDHGALIVRIVNGDWQQERFLLGHIVHTLDGEPPFTPKIPLEALLRVVRDHRNEQSAIMYLTPDLLIPNLPAP